MNAKVAKPTAVRGRQSAAKIGTHERGDETGLPDVCDAPAARQKYPT
jgi:hypothetical protein